MIKKREQEKGLDRSKMVVFSNYFFDPTQGHSQINGCTVRNVYIKEAFDTSVRCDFKGNFNLEELERGIEETGSNNVPYIVATITSNSAGGQPISLANLLYYCTSYFPMGLFTGSVELGCVPPFGQ